MKKIKLLIALLAFCLGASAQVPIPKFIYCTLGDFPDEISWNIKNCSGTELVSGYAGDSTAALIPDVFTICMEDNYGDGWNGAYLYIVTDPFLPSEQIDSFGFLSDIDWIDSIGDWPQIYTDTVLDAGCITLSTGTGSMITNIDDMEYKFEPTEYYNIAGQKVIPSASGIYIASDGYIRRLVYITKK